MMHPALLELLLKERQRGLEKRARRYAIHGRTPTKQSGTPVKSLGPVHLSDGARLALPRLATFAGLGSGPAEADGTCSRPDAGGPISAPTRGPIDQPAI